MTTYLTPSGECACKKPKMSANAVFRITGKFHIDKSKARDKFHAAGIRDALKIRFENPEHGLAEDESDKIIDAILKCMEGSK